MYKMTLADETEIEFEGLNGTNLIVPGKKEMDTSVFTDENLKNVTITTEDGEEIELHNLAFIQQQKQLDGDYYVCFYEKSEQQVRQEELWAAMVQTLEAEVSAGNIVIEDIPEMLQEEVKVKIDDGKRLDK